MQSASENSLIATFQLSSAASLNLGRSHNGVLGNGLKYRNIAISRMFNPLPDDKNLDWSKLKQSADNNFEFDVNSRKFSKLVENTVGKGEIARNEQFLLFP